MAIYREGYHAVDKIIKNSKNIFSDACDNGAPTRKGDEIWNLAKQLVEWYGDKESRKESRYSTGSSVTNVITLIDEWAVSDERKTLKQATEKFIVSYVTCKTGACRGYHGYISIEKI